MSVRERVLEWRDCSNVRDLGGLPAAADGRTRRDVLIRADALDRLSDQGVTQVKDRGVTRIVDLRSPGEVTAAGHPFHGDSAYRMVPFIDERRDHERDRNAEHTLADLYRGSLDRNGRCIGAAVSAIATAPDGPVVVHCAAGKDRTGMLVALVLDAVGVPRSVIAEDYAASERGPGATAAPVPAAGDPQQRRDRQDRVRREWMWMAHQETILETLAHVDTRHDGVHAYLAAGGVSENQIGELRSRLVLTAE
jgi:protein-tyrosine phosphatase